MPDSGAGSAIVAYPSTSSSAQVETKTARVLPEGAYLRRGTGPEFSMEAEWARRWVPANAARIVDVGCGNGALFPWLSPARTMGFDWTIAGLRIARTRTTNGGVACASADCLPVADQSVDAVIAQHVIEHLPEPDAAIREWRRILRPGGALLILTPNAAFRDPSVFEDPTHVQLFHARTLRDAVRRCGLRPHELRTLGLPWFRRNVNFPGGWRLRRFILVRAYQLSIAPFFRWRGQTLCCAATREPST